MSKEITPLIAKPKKMDLATLLKERYGMELKDEEEDPICTAKCLIIFATVMAAVGCSFYGVWLYFNPPLSPPGPPPDLLAYVKDIIKTPYSCDVREPYTSFWEMKRFVRQLENSVGSSYSYRGSGLGEMLNKTETELVKMQELETCTGDDYSMVGLYFPPEGSYVFQNRNGVENINGLSYMTVFRDLIKHFYERYES